MLEVMAWGRSSTGVLALLTRPHELVNTRRTPPPSRRRRAGLVPVDDAELFFFEGYTLRRVAAAGGSPSDAASLDGGGSLCVTDMEIDDDAVWILAGGLYRFAR
ncbi:MAG TPA: hypothetical protein PKW35_24700 [Nannocystaceae bacterium]|nr:hypothetical protein [Nannocystaceae bacterium]